MERWNHSDAMYQLRLCRHVKDDLRTWWKAAQHYWDNDFVGERSYDPEVLLSRKVIERWGIDNIIPYAMRVREANIMVQPLTIRVEPYGASDDMLMVEAANGLDDMVHYFNNRPEANRGLREIIRRMSLFNAVAEVDWYSQDEFKEGPKIRVIPHHDIFMDINAIEGVNEINGPRWISLRYRLTPDEAELMFPGKSLDYGIKSEKANDAYEKQKYDDRAEIYEWFGIDESRKQISDADAEATVLNQLSTLMSGGDIDPHRDEDHEFAIKYAQAWVINEVQEMTGRKLDKETAYLDAINVMVDSGMGEVAQVVDYLVNTHQAFIDEGIDGGTEPVYPGSVYRVVFQHGIAEPVVEPEVLEYPHAQIPVSFYRAHCGTRRLFSKGFMTEVLTLQAELEWWEKAEIDLANIVCRPPMTMPIDLMDKNLDASGRKKLISDIKKGFHILWTRVANYQKGVQPEFVNVGGQQALAHCHLKIEQKRQRIFEIIGSTAVLRGESPVGAEASGKRVQIQQAAAARPLNDTLALIEAPRQKREERVVSNILHYASYEIMESVAGMQRAQAIMQVREAFPAYRPIVKVDFGFGAPTDWYSQKEIMDPIFFAGLMSGEEYSERLNLAFKIETPQPAPAQNPGQTAVGQQQVPV